MRTQLGIRNIPTPSVESVVVNSLVIPDDANGFQRSKVNKKVAELLGLLDSGYKLLPIMVARIAGTKMLVMDGGQRTRAYRAKEIGRCDAIVYDFPRENEDLLTRMFMATDNSARISSNHIAWTWPGTAGDFLRNCDLAKKNLLNYGKGKARALAAGILARGLLVAVEGGTASKGIQPTMQAIDDYLRTDEKGRTLSQMERFIKVVDMSFQPNRRVELCAMLAVAQVFHDKNTYPGKRVAKIDWAKETRDFGRTLKHVPAWRYIAEQRW